MDDIFSHLDDDLDAAPAALPVKHADRLSEANGGTRSFSEPCRKCGGTGFYGRLGRCFACKGKGQLTFKTSAAERAKGRENAQARKARTIAEGIAAFKAACPEVHAWIEAEANKPTPFAFAVAMRDALTKYGDLTERQLETCQRLTRQAAERKAVREAERALRAERAPAVSTSAIEAAFAVALERASRPGQMGAFVKPLRLQANGVAVQIRPGSPGSQWKGMLFLKTEAGKKIGHVKDGRFMRRYECSDVEAEAAVECMARPKDALHAYAKAWSRCGICNRTLLNDESIERGIGPICAEKFGW